MCLRSLLARVASGAIGEAATATSKRPIRIASARKARYPAHIDECSRQRRAELDSNGLFVADPDRIFYQIDSCSFSSGRRPQRRWFRPRRRRGPARRAVRPQRRSFRDSGELCPVLHRRVRLPSPPLRRSWPCDLNRHWSRRSWLGGSWRTSPIAGRAPGNDCQGTDSAMELQAFEDMESAATCRCMRAPRHRGSEGLHGDHGQYLRGSYTERVQDDRGHCWQCPGNGMPPDSQHPMNQAG